MKLIIQIPCFNEEATLEKSLRDLPPSLVGIDQIETLIVDDGSTDCTAQAAQRCGVRHLVRFRTNRGLAAAFCAGLEAALAAGADIIVNTDADNQYCGEDLAKLIQPILEQKADMVVGDRGVAALGHFSWIKRRLQALGSKVVERASGIPIPDATSGFRAFSREAAMRLTVLSDYTYTLETLIQAGARRMAVSYIPVRTNPQNRPSRLMRNMPSFISLSMVTILRFYVMYRPLQVFMSLGTIFILAGMLLGFRFLYYFFLGFSSGHIQSLILAAILIIVGFQTGLIGLIADLVRLNRKMLEETLYGVRRLQQNHNSTSVTAGSDRLAARDEIASAEKTDHL